MSDVLSAALDSGLAFSVILIFFTLQYPKNGKIGATNIQVWWGNTVFSNTADGQGLPYKPLPASGTFGYVLVIWSVSNAYLDIGQPSGSCAE